MPVAMSLDHHANICAKIYFMPYSRLAESAHMYMPLIFHHHNNPPIDEQLIIRFHILLISQRG